MPDTTTDDIRNARKKMKRNNPPDEDGTAKESDLY